MKHYTFNLCLIAASVVLAPLCVEALNFASRQPPRFLFVVAVPSFVAFGVLLVCFRADLAEDPGKTWWRPNLRNSSFVSGIRQPLQLFAMNGHVMMALAGGAAIYDLVLKEQRWEWVLFLCVGVGVYLGLYLAMFFFKDRIIE